MIDRADASFEYWTTSKLKVSVRKITHKDGAFVEFEESRVTEEEALTALEEAMQF